MNKQKHMNIDEKNKFLLESTGTGICIIEADGTLSFANNKLAQILQTDTDHIIGTPFLQWISDEDKIQIAQNHQKRLSGETVSTNYDFRFKTYKGITRWGSVYINFFQETASTIVSVLDIDIYKQTEQQLKEAIASQNAFFNAIPDLMFELDTQGRYINIWANNPGELVCSKEMLLGRTVNEVLNVNAAQQVMSALQDAKKTGHSFGKQIHIHTIKGNLWFELSVSSLEKESPLQHFLLLSRNITDRKLLEKKLEKISNTDPLTGLYNRRKLKTKLLKEFYKVSRHSNPLSLLFFDIDHFKKINDAYGHENGDIVLVNLAKSLKKSIRETDNAYRYGGEEFIVVMEDTLLKDAKEFAERFRSLIESTIITLNTNEKINITISIGVAAVNSNIQSAEELIALADSRMYLAKTSGRNCVIATD
jgi:diguanylate cyclase (GGDEF)-like protein/PAS domain S-box-containing protein